MENYKHLIPIIFISLATLLGFYSGYYVTDKHWQTKWSNAEATAATKQLNAVDAATKKSNERIIELEATLNDTKQKLAEANLADATAVANGDSLQQSFAISLRESDNCANNTTSVRDLAAEATNRTVQAYVFNSIVKEAIGYARIAEEAIVIGLACEADYNTIRK